MHKIFAWFAILLLAFSLPILGGEISKKEGFSIPFIPTFAVIISAEQNCRDVTVSQNQFLYYRLNSGITSQQKTYNYINNDLGQIGTGTNKNKYKEDAYRTDMTVL